MMAASRTLNKGWSVRHGVAANGATPPRVVGEAHDRCTHVAGFLKPAPLACRTPAAVRLYIGRSPMQRARAQEPD